MYIIVGGYGMQAQAIGRYLLDHTNEEIIIVDKAQRPSHGFWDNSPARVTHSAFNVADTLSHHAGQGHYIVLISCAPTQHNPEIASLAKSFEVNYIDLGGELHHTEEVLKTIGDSGQSTFMLDCGIAPGTVSCIVGHYIRGGWENVEIFCGGIPQRPDLLEPHRYGITFNAEGLIKEYTGVVTAVKNGNLIKVPALSEMEEIFVDGLGYLEAVHMSGSLSKTPEFLDTTSKQSFSYKTLRWPGHWQWVKENVLIHPNPDEVAESVFPRITQDYLVLLVRTNGKIQLQRVWEAKDGLTGMQQATGFSVGAIATMVHEGMVNPGIQWMHDIDFKEYWKRVNLPFTP